MVEVAFNFVLDAEKAGANVTDLLDQLNGAADLLAQTENAYVAGDNNQATKDANEVLPIVQQVVTQAQNARESAASANQYSFLSTIAFALIGSIVFVLVLFLVWRRFKKRYINN